MTNKQILITGVAGSGKSTICGEFKKLGYRAYSIEDIKGLFSLIDKKTGKIIKSYDNNDIELIKQRDWVCDKKKLQKIINKNSKGIVFYCGTAVNLDELIPLFNKIFLLQVDQKVLSKRLSKRKLSDLGKASEVQKWLFGWRNWWEDYIHKKGATIIGANRDIRKVAIDIINKS